MVYNFILCNETYFYEYNESLFRNKKIINNESLFHKLRFIGRFKRLSLRYQQFQNLFEFINNDEKIMDKVLFYKNKLMEPQEIVDKLKLNITLSDKIQSHILFSELACFDLEYYLNGIFDSKDNSNIIYYLLSDIFKGIQDLQVKLDLLHNDLHLGNILLINDNDSIYGYKILIHDFGKSRKLIYEPDSKGCDSKSLIHFDKEHDLFYFISKFEEKLKEYLDDSSLNPSLDRTKINRILKALDEVIDAFYNSKDIYPIKDVVIYWESQKQNFLYFVS